MVAQHEPKDLAELGARSSIETMKAERTKRFERSEEPPEIVCEVTGVDPRWTPAVARPAKEPPAAVLVRASDVIPRRVDWLWKGRIPFGMLTLLDGDPGLGKSTLTLDIVARVTRGDVMPDGGPWMAGGPGTAIVIMLEDAVDVTIRPRLDAAGADVERVLVMTGVRDDGADRETERPPVLPVDVGLLRDAIVTHKARLVVIDPLMAYLGGDTDSHKDQDIRRALTPLARVAEDTGAAIIIVRHLRKSAGPALYRGGGSIGIMGSARMALFLARDPDDPNARILAVSKSNIAPDTVPALRWRLVDTDSGVARAQWEGVAEGVTADQLANQVPETAKEGADEEDGGGACEKAVAALRQLLEAGPVASRTAERGVMDEVGCSKATMRRAREVLRVVATPDRVKGRVTGWTWTLPESPDAHSRSTIESE